MADYVLAKTIYPEKQMFSETKVQAISVLSSATPPYYPARCSQYPLSNFHPNMKALIAVLLCLLLYSVYLLHGIVEKLNAAAPPVPASAQVIAAEVVKQMSVPPQFQFHLGPSDRDEGGIRYQDLKLDRTGGIASAISVTSPESITVSCETGTTPVKGGEEFVIHFKPVGKYLPAQFSFVLHYSTVQTPHATEAFTVPFDANKVAVQQVDTTSR